MNEQFNLTLEPFFEMSAYAVALPSNQLPSFGLPLFRGNYIANAIYVQVVDEVGTVRGFAPFEGETKTIIAEAPVCISVGDKEIMAFVDASGIVYFGNQRALAHPVLEAAETCASLFLKASYYLFARQYKEFEHCATIAIIEKSLQISSKERALEWFFVSFICSEYPDADVNFQEVASDIAAQHRKWEGSKLVQNKGMRLELEGFLFLCQRIALNVQKSKKTRIETSEYWRSAILDLEFYRRPRGVDRIAGFLRLAIDSPETARDIGINYSDTSLFASNSVGIIHRSITDISGSYRDIAIERLILKLIRGCFPVNRAYLLAAIAENAGDVEIVRQAISNILERSNDRVILGGRRAIENILQGKKNSQ